VPSNLKIMRPSEQFPELGTVGISLINANRKNQAVHLLTEFLRASLA